MSGVDLATVLFDVSPVPEERGAQTEDDWTPTPEPTQAELIAEGVKGAIRAPADIAGSLMKAARDPGGTVRAAREAAEGIGEIVWAGLNPAPETPLNVSIGPHRRVWWVRSSLADFKAIKNALGGTVNDVMLAVVSGALGRWLRTRGVRTEGLELRALVPVSIRSPGTESDLGNQIAAMRGPAARLRHGPDRPARDRQGGDGRISSSRSRRSAPRSSQGSTTSPRRRCSPRPRG